MLEVKSVLQDKFNKNKLSDNYKKALEDENFKELIQSLEIDEKKLMKNTSKLQDALVEIKTCKNCKNLLSCKNKINGFCYRPQVKGELLTFDYVACDYYLKYEEENSYRKNVYLFDIPKEIKEASIKNFYKDDKNRVETLKYLNDFYKNYFKNPIKGLYLHGNFGCGKTYMIAAIFNELAKHDVRSAIVYYPEFLRSLKESFTDNDAFKEKFLYIKKVPLLLLDDIGAENSTAWARDEILGPILQYRMQEHLPTFFTSNLTINELEEHFSITKEGIDKVKSRRIIERIISLTHDITMIGVNRRK